MHANDAINHVLKTLREQRQDKLNAVGTGSCDPGAYKFGCGEIHGLDLAIAELLAVQQKVEDDDDDD